MAWHLPGGATASRLQISAPDERPLYLHLINHPFAPATFGPETAFALDGPSLCRADGTPIVFTDRRSGYFADVYAAGSLEFVVSTDAEPPGE